MKRNLTIQLKAALLLVVFGLNTAVGFACAVGVDMDFNTSHHNEDEATEIHTHADGGKHHHEEAENNTAGKQDKGDCCNDSVIKLSQADKSVPPSATIISPVFFATFIPVFYTIDIFYTSQISVNIRYFVRGHHPPIPDIRIAIQSFQI